MGLEKHAALFSVFVGGCLSGAAILSLSGVTGESDDESKRRALVTQAPTQSPPDRAPSEMELEREPVVLSPTTIRLENESEVEAPDDDSRSASEVLAYLEAAYQQGIQTAPAPEVDQVIEPPPPETNDESTEQLEMSLRTEGNDALVDNEVAVVLNQTDTHESDAHHGDLVVGDKVLGDKVEGDVHVGDLNQVRQVALLYQPVVVVAPNQPASVPRANPPTRRSARVNPYGSVTISPKHDPWKTMLAEPGSPWSSVGPLRR